MEKVKTEKCYCCNGSRKEMEWDNDNNRWTRGTKPCIYCKGTKIRKYVEYANGRDFLFKKTYIV